MDESVKIEISGRIDGKIASSIRDIARAALEADNNLDLLRQALREINSVEAFRGLSSDARSLRNEVRQTQGAVNALGGAVNGVASDFNKAGTAARKFAQEAKAAGNSVNSVKTAATGLKSTLGGLGLTFSGIFAIQQYAQAQDALTSIQNQIRTITTGAGEAAKLQQTLFDLANRTRTGVESTTAAYVNFFKNLSAIGAKEEEVLRIVETLNKGFQVGGKSAAEAAGSTRQFIQGLQNGALRGEEFNSVMEGFPVEIVRAFAETLGVNQTELRKMAEQGKITADVIREAMGVAAGSVDELFARLTPTIGSTLTVLNNKFIEFTASTSGSAKLLGQAILFIADNLNIVIPLIAAFGVAWAVVSIASIIQGIAALTLSLIPLTAQIGLVVAAAATLVAALYSLGYIASFAAGAADEYENMVASLGAYVIKLGESIGQQAAAAIGLNTTGAAAGATAANFDALAASAASANTDIQLIGAGSAGVATLKDGVYSVNTALGQTSTVAAAANDNLVSLSGTAAGIYNVQDALSGVNGQLSAANNNTQQTARGLGSLAGTAAGIYRVADALNAVAAAAASAASNLAQARSEQAAASGRNRDKTVPNGGDSSGSFTNITGNMSGNSFQNLPALARGGTGIVGGTGRGVDRNMVAFRANRGERVDVSTKAQQRRMSDGLGAASPKGPTYVNVNIATANVESFRRSRGQIATDILGSMG